MTLVADTKLGPYEIVAARRRRLGRSVQDARHVTGARGRNQGAEFGAGGIIAVGGPRDPAGCLPSFEDAN
jgi:hypothetical protein